MKKKGPFNKENIHINESMRDNLRTSIRRIVNIRTSIRRIEQLDSDKLTIVIDKESIPEKLKMIGLMKWIKR